MLTRRSLMGLLPAALAFAGFPALARSLPGEAASFRAVSCLPLHGEAYLKFLEVRPDWNIRVFLDGEELTHVISADAEAGHVLRIPTTLDGRVADDLRAEVAYGHVDIRLDPFSSGQR